jgi:hypothetical protein
MERGVFLNATIRKHVCPLGCVFQAIEYHFYESLHEMHTPNEQGRCHAPEVINGVTLQNHWYFRGGLVDGCLFLGYVRLNLTIVVAVR